MSTSTSQFRIVRRGYEPDRVDNHLRELTDRLAAAEATIAELRERPEVTVQTPYENLGARVATMLQLAEEESTTMRETARAEAAALRSDVEQSTRQLRLDADAHATERMRSAEDHATKILDDAKRTAHELIESAQREAEACRQEAGALLESQRAEAAIAANAFETDLAVRRDESDATLRSAINDHQNRMLDLDEHLEKRRVEAERRHLESVASARRVLDNAHTRADEIVSEAKATAARIMLDHEREVAAIKERRDSINAQLINVRGMLSALSGGSAPLDPLAIDETN